MKITPEKIDKLVATNEIKLLLLHDCNSDVDSIKNQLSQLTDYNFILEFTNQEPDFKALLKSFKPNLVLSELHLSNYDGKKALEFCKVFFPEIPFLFVTDTLCNKTAIEFLKHGATDFLLKDSIQELPATIFKALRHSEEKLAIKTVKQKRWEDTQRFKSLIEHSQDPVLTYNNNGVITYVSPAIKKVLGYSVKEFIGTNVKDHIHPDDLIIREHKFEEFLTNNKPFYIIEEERLLHKNGHHIWAKAVVSDAQLSPGIQGFMTNFRDITESKHSQLELEKTLKALTDYKVALVESSIVVITDTKGVITFANEEFCKVSKYSEQELKGQFLIDFNENYHPQNFYLELIETIASGNIWKGEIKKNAKDGSYYWVNGTIIPFTDTNGEQYQYIVVMQDITDRKRKTEELSESLELVNAQNKRLLNFSYIVSHNLRSHSSNLQSILGFLDAAKDENEKKEMISYLKDVTKSLNDTLYNLNEVVSIQSNTEIKKESLPLLDYVEATISNLNPDIQDTKAKIDISIPKHLNVNFNKGYLESVLQNIIHNSIKYRHPDRQPEITITTKMTENAVVLSVSDNGLGIDLKKNKHKIFGMYKTFHGNKNALGLGLFMTKNQVEAMGGNITVESDTNKGTTFNIEIKNV
jgi:PAS domain S-box-containing protein